LGNLNITTDILDTRVREAIDRQIAEHNLMILAFDSTAIDWQRLVTDAAFRRPPFQVGEREKGFRDAIILESFLQLKEASPSSASSCRLALVSGDGLLRSAAAVRASEASNIHILDSIDALKGLINTLGSAVDEQFIGALLPKAAKLFFASGDQGTLYYRWSIFDQLKATLAAAAIALPAGADKYNVEEWNISKPRFSKKQGQRVSWVSRFEARLRAVKIVEYSAWQQATKVILPSVTEQALVFGTSQPSTLSLGSSLSGGGLKYSQPSEGGTFFTPGLLSFPEEQPIASGTATIDVTWTVSVTTALNFKSPRLDGISFVDAIWE
jgi:hypothetical protein